MLRNRWTQASSTIIFEQHLLDHGLGSFNMATGRFKAGTAGKYVVSWDLYTHMFRNESVILRLFRWVFVDRSLTRPSRKERKHVCLCRQLPGKPAVALSNRQFSMFGVTSGMTEFDNVRDQGGRTQVT